MSYTPEFTDDARASWGRMDLSLQEEVLDAAERIAADPALLRRSKASPEWTYDFVHDVGALRHYVFLIVRLNRTNERIVVLKLGHSAHPVPPPIP